MIETRKNQRHSSAAGPTHFTRNVRNHQLLLRIIEMVIKCPELRGYPNSSAAGSRGPITRGSEVGRGRTERKERGEGEKNGPGRKKNVDGLPEA